MKSALLFVLFAASALAQGTNMPVQNACGSQKIWFDVTLDATKHVLAQPEPGKARVYIVQDEAGTGVTQVGNDGAWVGALKDGSWLSLSVSPGEHHFCVSHQSHLASGRYTELLHFTVEAGKVYYLRIRYLAWTGGPKGNSWGAILFKQVDSDQAIAMIGAEPAAVWCPSDTCALP
jgi:hypothetical protein